jgi:hypothetical protein
MEVDPDDGGERGGVVLADRRRRAGDAGVVDQHVETAEGAPDVTEQPIQGRCIAHVGDRAAEVLVLGGDRFERGLVDVGDVQIGPVGDECSRDG